MSNNQDTSFSSPGPPTASASTTFYVTDGRCERSCGGVADPAGKTGFFPNTSGGIDSLDLANGKLLWTSKDANRPLLATETRLFARQGKANSVRIVVLDATKQGQRVFESQPLALPDWSAVEPDYGMAFRNTVRLDGNELLVSWEAGTFYAGSARPTPQVEAAAPKFASGVARGDAATGRVEALDAEAIAAGKFFPLLGDAINPQGRRPDAPGA